jgi:hypothetical protein
MRVNCWITRFVIAGDSRVSSRDCADRRDQLLRRVVLEHEPARAGPERFVDVLVEAERREDQDPRRLVRRQDAPGCLEAVELGHADVHQDHVRIKTRGLGHGLESVARFRHDFHVLLAGQQHPEPGADID